MPQVCHRTVTLLHVQLSDYKEIGCAMCGATRKPEFPWTRLDQNRSGAGAHFIEYFRVGSGNFISSRSESVFFFFYRGMRHFFPRISGINLNLN